MKTNYESMSNEELDRLSAERFYGGVFNQDENNIPKVASYHGQQVCIDGRWVEWRPTYRHSNQAEVYLFPKITKMESEPILEGDKYESSVDIEMIYSCDEGFQIIIYDYERDNIYRIEPHFNQKQLNRSKVLVCLIALDYIEKVIK